MEYIRGKDLKQKLIEFADSICKIIAISIEENGSYNFHYSPPKFDSEMEGLITELEVSLFYEGYDCSLMAVPIFDNNPSGYLEKIGSPFYKKDQKR